MAKGSTVRSAEGGADFRRDGRGRWYFQFGIYFLCLLVPSVEFEVQDLSRLEREVLQLSVCTW